MQLQVHSLPHIHTYDIILYVLFRASLLDLTGTSSCAVTSGYDAKCDKAT